MKFLIIGASGFIGRHVLNYIKSSGCEAIGTQSGSKYKDLKTFDLLKHRIKKQIEPSFFDTDEQIIGIICASISQIDRCFQDKKISYTVNVKNTIRLIQDMDALKIKPVFLSSSFVYDGTVGYYNEESHPLSPVSEYGRHKVEVENFIRSESSNTLIFRLDKIVGDDPLENHLLSECYRIVKKKQPIICIEGQLFSPTFVNDVAKAIVLSCQFKLSGVYNLANPEFFSRDELVRQFIVALGENAEIICKSQNDLNFLDMRPPKSYLDSTRFIKKTGMRFTSMREVFKNFIDKTNSVKNDVGKQLH